MSCNSNNHPLIDSTSIERGCNNSCVPKNINIVCKEIIIPDGQEIISVKGEKNANSRTFLIPKTTSNGDDLSDKTFTILTEDSKGYQTSTLIEEKGIVNNYIKIKWIIPENATINEGDLLVSIQASADDYLWSTLPAKFTVADAIEVAEEGEIVVPSIVTKLQMQISQLQNSLIGGETGTVLTKKSNGDLDFQWSTVTIPDVSAIYQRIQDVEDEIPSNTSELVNDSDFINSNNIDISVQKNISINASGDNVSLNKTDINLKTKAESSTSETMPLANATQAGLMAMEDYETLVSLSSRVQSLEGKATRILYINSNTKNDITVSSTTMLTAGSRLAAGSVIGGKTSPIIIEIEEDTFLETGDIIKSGSIIANASTINDISYPTAQDINEFTQSLGYEAPFKGIAVVTLNTYHIWHYYENGGIEWRDDGVDTSTNFTNTAVGLIKGSETNGKIFAETDGTGSVNGWDSLTNEVANLETKVETIKNLASYSTEEKVIGVWIDGKPLYRKIFQQNVGSGQTTINAPANIKSVITLRGMMVNPVENFNFPIPQYESSSIFTRLAYVPESKQIQITCGSSDWSSGSATIIIEYTKTTD